MTLAPNTTINLFFEKCPIHVCETPAIAAAVVEDMQARLARRDHNTKYSEMVLDADASRQITIDFGGSIVYPPTYIHVPDVPRLAFLPQHASLLKIAVWKTRQQGVRLPGNYFKVHADRANCLSPESFQALERFLSEEWDQISEKEVAEMERWGEATAQIKQHPNIG